MKKHIQDLETRLEQYEQALQASEARFRNIIERNADGIVIVDTHGAVRFVNPAAEALLGIPAQQLVGELFGFPLVVNGTTEIDILRGEGPPHIAEMRVVQTEWEGEKAYLASLRNITQRRQTELEVDKFRTLFDHANFGAAVSDLDGNMLYLNEYFASVHGYTPDELIGEHLSTFHTPAQIKHVREINQRLHETGSYHGVEVWHKHRDGHEFPMLMNGVTIKNEVGKPSLLAATAIDITERKRAEKALAWEAQVNAVVAELSKAMIASASLDEISWLVLERAKQLTGSRYGYAGHIDLQTGHLLCSTMTRDIWETCQVHEKTIVFEEFGGLWGWVLRNRRSLLTNDPTEDARSSGVPPGHIPIRHFLSAPALINDTLVGQIALANPDRPYTEQDLALVERLASLYALAIQHKRAEDALRENEERYRVLFNSGSDAVFVHPVTADGRPGRFVEVNDIACHRLGYTREELLERSPSDIDAPEAQDRIPQVMEDILVDKHALFASAHVTKDGQHVPVEINAHLFELHNERMILSVARDVTERQEMESQLRQYAEQLEQLVSKKVEELELERAKTLHTAKLASLGQMATGVAHELNQPLTAMLFEADYLRSSFRDHLEQPDSGLPIDAAELHQMGENLVQDVNRCRRIINHLRAFGRVSSGEPTHINLNQPIENSFILTQERLKQHSILLKTDLAPELPPILADSNRLEQVFLNLISNAEDAMNDMERQLEGTNGKGNRYQKVLEISTSAEDGFVVARVSDNGHGISNKDRERLFEPFFTTKPVGEGTGLGLSISFGIVTEYGGEITCESEENEGTTFTLKFPALRDE